MSGLRCQVCKKSKQTNAFSKSQLKKSKLQRKCKKCIQNHQANSNHSSKNAKTQQPKSKRNMNNTPKQPTTILLQKLHKQCSGKSFFTEIHLAIKIKKNQQNATQSSLQNIFADIPDTFVYHNRIIIASNHLSDHREIYNAIVTNIPLEIHHQKTRYCLTELLYANGKISSRGVTFCSENNRHISDLFATVCKPVIKDNLDELVVFGYCREIAKNIKRNVMFVCFSYYECKDVFSMCGALIKIVNKIQIQKMVATQWCCAFGSVSVDSQSKNRYQWTLYIDKMHSNSDYFGIGITSERDINEVFVNKNYPNYAYVANGVVENCNEAHCKHKGKTASFGEGDTIVMDVDFVRKQLRFVINGKEEGCLIADIICGPMYYLGICMAHLGDSVSIKRFTWFNDAKSS